VSRPDSPGWRNALSQAGVSELILFLGTNDLWFGASPPQVIDGLEQAIAEAHAAGVRIVGVTLLPRSASLGRAMDSPAAKAISNRSINDGSSPPGRSTAC